MSIETTHMWRKKPVEVEARRWDGTASSAAELLAWMAQNDTLATHHEHREPRSRVEAMNEQPTHIMITTLEGPMMARPGWWIIKGVKGEFYACDPEVFDATYEKVELDMCGAMSPAVEPEPCLRPPHDNKGGHESKNMIWRDKSQEHTGEYQEPMSND